MTARGRKLVLAFVVVAAAVGACSGGGSNDAAAGGSGGGGSGGGGSGGATMCGSNTCSPNEVCVRTQTLGGARLCPQDGATCPNGYDLIDGCCVQTPAWACVARPTGCGATVTCDCARATLCTAGHTCTMPRENEIDCTLLAP